MTATRVLVADDFPLMLEAFAATLAADPAVEVVATAIDGVDALEKAREQRPDVVVLDLRMPRMTGTTVLRCLANELPETRGLVVTGYDDPDAVAEALDAGAAGVLTKRATGDELRGAIQDVRRGERVLSPSLAPTAPAVGREGPAARFSACELEVLCLIAGGATDGAVSTALGLSPRTVQNRLTRIRQKTGVERRTELARWAGEHLGI
jgi:two-component system, NarL family, response regulator DevR